VIAIKMTAYIVSLILMAIILAMLFLPAMNWLRKKGIPDIFAVTIITVFAFLVIVGIVFLAVMSFHALVADVPQFQQELNTRLADIYSLLASFGFSPGSTPPSFDLANVISVALSGAMSLVEGLMFLFFAGVTTFFLLLDAPRMASRVELVLGKDPDILRKLSRMTGYVTDFMVVRTETNFIHGILFGSFLGIMGVHGAILWGVLTFLLGYIPYFGLMIAAVPAIFFAWLQFGIPGALAVIAAVCILNIIVENPVYSYLAARKFEMPALIVIVSVIFWGWLLGIIGMFFAIPFTLTLLMIFESSDDLRWVNTIIGVSHLFEESGDTKHEPGDVPLL
jgi:AI-2 transport protein TqsA